MAFTEEQNAHLAAPLSPDRVLQNDKGFGYVEAWWAIAEANRIFGFDGWSRETLEMRCIQDGTRKTRNGPKAFAGYIARVRVKVWAGDRVITHDGEGGGSGYGSAEDDVAGAHESAVKEATSDALKRALINFGNPFGLALYDKSKANVREPDPPELVKAREMFPHTREARRWQKEAAATLGECTAVSAVDRLFSDMGPQLANLKMTYPTAYEALVRHKDKVVTALRAQEADDGLTPMIGPSNGAANGHGASA